MATLYVDTDVDGGLGDGSSLANAYASLSAAVAALPATFTEDETILCHATSGTADTTGVTLPNTGSYSLTVKPGTGQEHDGVWDTSVYRLETANAIALTIGTANAIGSHIVDGLQIRRTTATANFPIVVASFINFRTGTVVVRGCIIRDPGNATYRPRTISVGGDGRFSPKSVYVNNIIYDVSTSTAAGSAVFYGAGSSGAGEVFMYNNTIIGGANVGFSLHRVVDQNDYKWVNNLITSAALGSTDADFVTAIAAGSDYNAFSEAIDTGGTNDRQSQTFTFQTDTYLIASTDAGALDHGTDLSADADYAFSDDIAGTTRSGTWDIGAYEYVADDDSISTDTISTTDEGSSNVEVSGTREDTATLTDSAEDNVDVSSLSEDALALTDSAESIAIILSSVADALALTDEGLAELVGAIEVAAVDTIVADDLGVSSATLNADAVDALALTDTGDTTESVDVAAADSVTLTDEVLIAVEIHVAAVDAIESADSGVTSVTFVVSAEDAAAFTDAAVSAGELIVEAVDSAGLTDSVVVSVNETAIVREYIFRPGGAVREITVPGGAVREITVPGGAVREIIVRGD